jgi:hypothetical protein
MKRSARSSMSLSKDERQSITKVTFSLQLKGQSKRTVERVVWTAGSERKREVRERERRRKVTGRKREV